LQLEGARTRSSSRRLRSLTGLPILIVDHNASNRKILEEIITNWRMKPVLAQSGVEALAALSTKRTGRDRIALALLDVHMPDMDGFSLAERIRQDPLNRDLKLILLTSAGRPDDIARCEALDISGYLTKPVKQSELFDEIVTALAKKTSKHKTSENVDQAVTSPAAMRILVAEDNPVNQTLAMRILEKLGHHVTLAINGREALDKSRSSDFDLVLMDVQMPHLDGLEATKLIRVAEKDTGKHVPIIAMTAHAMKGDRERCIEAGMDGYLSKPIRIEELKASLSEVGQARTSANSGVKFEIDFKEIGRVDVLLDGVLGDRQLLREMAELWLRDSAKQIEQLKAGFEQNDSEMVRKAAHAIKGSVGNFGATVAQNAAQDIESLASNGNLASARELFKSLTHTLEKVRLELQILSEHLKTS